MKKLGDKKHKHSKVEGHQNCSICQPEVKNGKAKHREQSKKEIEKELTDLPTYKELADLLIELTEINIANIDLEDDQFVSCFTYGTGNIPNHWKQAIEYRKLLKENNV